MSDPIKCKKCGAVSYNDPGKTMLACWNCVKEAETMLKNLYRASLALVNKIRTGEEIGEIDTKETVLALSDVYERFIDKK